jgi:predicted nucleic-acid-binding Zn-ribbon protein
MGSVISNVNCPRCGSEECFEDFYYKTGEIFSSCPDCGYHRSSFYKRDDNGKLIKLDESKGFEFDNLVIDQKYCPEPYGAYKLRIVGELGGVSGTLITKEDYDGLVQEVDQLQKTENSVEFFVVSRFVDGKIVKEEII